MSEATDFKLELFNDELQKPYIFEINKVGILSYTFAQSNFALIESIYFMNNTNHDMKDLVCSINFEFDFVKDFEIEIEEVKTGEFVEITPKFSIRAKKLFELTESLKDYMVVSIKDKEGKEYVNETTELPVLPINQWSGQTIFPETIASFVTPNTPEVIQLTSNASQHLKSITGNPSFVGYDGSNKNEIRQQMAAIYSAIYEQKIAYATIPPSFEKFGQRVRTITEMLNHKMGNCIEMSVLFCAIAEACGLNPFIVVTKGHAFAGIWLTDQNFDSNVIYDYSAINKRLASGINDLEVVECTAMNSEQNIDFEQAVQLARRKLETSKEFELVIDVRRTHYSTIRPMPQLVKENGEVKLIDYGLAEDAVEKGIVSQSVEDYYLSVNEELETTKSQIWMRNLLDLSKRNPLISFKPANRNSIQLISSNLMELEDEISDGTQFEIREITSDWKYSTNSMKFVDIQTHSHQINQISESEFKSKRIRTFLEKVDLDKRLKSISRESLKSLEENGANTLFLAVGFLEWVDNKGGKDANGNYRSYLAPLVLLPIDLINHSKGKYSIQLRDEDPQFNVTLLELLKQQFNLNINHLTDLPIDDSGVDLKIVFNTVRKAIMDFDNWDVHEIAFIGLFSFSQFVMWNDLKMRFNKLTENKIVKGLVEGYYNEDSDPIEVNQLDSELDISDLAIPSHTDSSQMTSIVSAAKGESFVLHGPPGTGKSQTITNMIANALYQGKTILFVAEKMAALNVVQDRLEKIGLGDFALELHSNKTKKSVVLEKLEHNLNLKSSFNEGEFVERLRQIEIAKHNLSEEVHELHRIRQQGFSLYDFILIHTQYNEYEGKYIIEKSVLESMSKVKLEEFQDLIHRLTKSMNALNFPAQIHPLKAFESEGYSLATRDKIEPLLYDALLKTKQFNSLIVDYDSSILRWLSRENLKELIASFSMESNNVSINLSEKTFEVLSQKHVLNLFSKLKESQTKRFNEIKNISIKYNSGIKDFDWLQVKSEFNQANNAIFLVKNKKIKKALEPLNNLTLSTFEVTKDNALEEFDIIANLQDTLKEEDEILTEITSLLVTDLNLNSLSQSEVEQFQFLITLVHKDSIKDVSNKGKEVLFNLVADYQKNAYEKSIIGQYEIISQLYTEIKSITGANLTSVIEEDYSLDKVIKLLEQWSNNIEEWQSWSYFYGQILQIINQGYEGFAKQLLTEETITVRLFGDLMKSIAKSMLIYYLEDSPNLAKFNRLDFESQISKYNYLIDEYEKLSKKAIHHKLSQNLPDRQIATQIESEQLGKLTRMIRSKGRGVSIRNIFEQNSKIIQRLAPVMLMSPLSVAQYIDLDFPKFDLVIFDEASQIPTGVAIGAMSRANDCIIVGDPNQMPPTSFFKSTYIDEDNLHIEDLESLLEDCLAINMPQRFLNWHYRSRSESLIAFSNQMYYRGNMKTFPSPKEFHQAVVFEKLDGVYDRGNTNTTRVEAEAIVKDIVERLESGSQHSIGVITFNSKQQNLIEDMLESKFSEEPHLLKLADQLSERIFVKNLENVQGDERDVILFSIGYGRDVDGKIYMNFGPLNRKGGWRRLNVAVSRARQEMKVFSIIESTDLNIKASTAEGVKGLKYFLEYAQLGHLPKTNNRNNTQESDALQLAIQEFLERNGYKTTLNLGMSGITIDLAVIEPNKSDKYIAGILLEGEQYRSFSTIRDRHRLLPEVLKGLDWNLHRIWSLNWVENQQREEDRLLSFLKGLTQDELPADYLETESKLVERNHNKGQDELANKPNQLVAKLNTQLEENHQSLVSVFKVIDYQKAQVEFSPTNVEDKKIAELILEIIEVEGPISENVLFRQVLTYTDSNRLTSRIHEVLTSHLNRIQHISTSSKNTNFYWKVDCDINQYNLIRKPGEMREIVDISDYELANALCYIAKNDTNFIGRKELMDTELIHALVRFYGYGRVTAKMQELCQSAVELAISKGHFVRVDEDTIGLV